MANFTSEEEQDDRRVLIAPINYIAKGHNIYPDVVYMFSQSNVRAIKLLYQLIGRAYRHGSQWDKVEIHIICPYYTIAKYNAVLYIYSQGEGDDNDKIMDAQYLAARVDRPAANGGYTKRQKEMNAYLLKNRYRFTKSCTFTVNN